MVIGRWKSHKSINSCLVYSMKCDKWSQIADINENKDHVACTVYEGKIVVSGGWGYDSLNSVEAFD